jgi:hypothetical protein
MEGFAAAFAGLEDPRTGNAKRHLLLEILLIALCSAAARAVPTWLCSGR